MTYHTVTTSAVSGKPAPAATAVSATNKPKPNLPPRQPLPTPVIDPNKPILALELDVHLPFIVAVGRRGHAAPQSPRRWAGPELVEYVRQAVADGFQVFCVQESCGFGFVLHRQLVEAGAQSFVITPEALSGKRKTDKLDARVLCLRLSRWLDGHVDELWPIRIPSEEEQRPPGTLSTPQVFGPPDPLFGQSDVLQGLRDQWSFHEMEENARPRPGALVTLSLRRLSSAASI